MKRIRFQWDTKKEIVNYKKHGIQFSEAESVFYDDNAREYFDPDHSEKEDRFLMLGMSRKLRVLIVSYCYRGNDEIIRIISARKADHSETQSYFAGGRS